MRFTLVYLFIFFGSNVFAQDFKGIPADLKKEIKLAREKHNIFPVATYFKGRPYSHFALSKSNPEKVYYSFQDFDCVTFIENVLALYYSNGMDSSFVKHLIEFRYAHPLAIRYETRLHYLSSAFEKWTRLGFVDSIHGGMETQEKKNIHYLSSFLVVKNLEVNVDELRRSENQISNVPFTYVARKDVALFLHQVKSGDIIAFVSKRNDLDFKHVGFITMVRGKAYLLHASQEKKLICISDQDVLTYLMKHPQMIGIQVFRPNLHAASLSF